ncbi:MAG: ORF6N domain-containing protein [Treponema sp.]|uniref:ORF6N domain-containing protein n=1 Tax=Treponema sp. TaxID=166 RepID=UPI0025FBD4AC|nr:ORF6N domain-containing protein [Treponema sp.]MBQ8680437.1 ORF6N domain-containing protein [Treponema sp.]
MSNEITAKTIEAKILTIRNRQVMIDRDLAEVYGTETKVLNQAVKRNIERFPEDFMFALDKAEKDELVTNCDRFETMKHSSVMPYAFTEQGVAMLSSVLKSHTAVEVNIQIMRAFVAMRHFLQNNAQVFSEINTIKKQLLDTNVHQKETDKKVEELFDLIDKYNVKDTQGIFFQGQIFDAYAKFESFIAQAKQEIILIDNYVDLSILQRLAKKKKNVNVVIYTDPKTKLTAQDIQQFNTQYPTLTLNHTTKMHDRFLIIDQKMLYHIGASLKDLGKKCFAFEVLDASLIAHLLKNV